MTMERFMLDGFQDERVYAELASSLTFPLVRELEFKYGLKVMHKTRLRTDTARGFRADVDAWMMGRKDGIAICKVFTTENTGGKNKDQLEFSYRSPFYSKERGSSSEDKQTLSSIKVSSLMATLTRCDAVPLASEMEAKKVQQCRSAMQIMRKDMGVTEKNNPFTTTEIHSMLRAVLGVSPDENKVALDLVKCKNTLDLFEETDKLVKYKREEVTRFFGNPFFMVGVDELGDYLIGKFKIKAFGEHSGAMEYEVVEPFKRYRSYESVTDLIPVMTMVKLSYENREGSSKAGVMPTADKYDQNLDAVFFYNTRPTHYDHLFMVTPCPV